MKYQSSGEFFQTKIANRDLFRRCSTGTEVS
jgi:hypothetical protein